MKNIALKFKGRWPSAPSGASTEVAVAVERNDSDVKPLLDALNGIAKTMRRKIIRKATRDGAKVVLVAARALVPVDSGALRKGLHVRALKRSKRRQGHKVATPSRERLGLAYQRVSDRSHPAYYPAVLEYGTKGGRPWKSDPTRRTKPRAPRPFLRPAMHGARPAVLDKVQETIADEVRSYWAGKNTAPPVDGLAP